MPILDTRKVRMPAVAGMFYDANPLELRRQLMAAEAKLPEIPKDEAPVQGVILPHAGYVFSMPAAMKTLRPAAGQDIRKAVILAPSHRVAFRGGALTESDVMRTPFGDLLLDQTANRRLAEAYPGKFVFREDAHRQEHAVEVQLPLLQYFFKDPEILPVVCGEIPLNELDAMAEALLAEAGKDTLWVISSDFTHYGRNFGYVPFTENVEENLYKLDLEAANLIVKRDLNGFIAFLQRTRATICGMFVILLYLKILQKLDPDGKIQGELAEYTNCGKQTGNWTHCVGYAGIRFR